MRIYRKTQCPNPVVFTRAKERPVWLFESCCFFLLTFLTHIIECLIIISTNCWIQCNAYKCPETPAFVALFLFCTCYNLENLLN